MVFLDKNTSKNLLSNPLVTTTSGLNSLNLFIWGHLKTVYSEPPISFIELRNTTSVTADHWLSNNQI